MPRVMFFNNNLAPLAEIECRTRRVWVLNRPDEELGKASVYIALREPKLNEELLRFRNVVYIRDTYGLPDWAGQVGEPQDYNQGEVMVAANAYEMILSDRTPGGGGAAGAPGAIFAELLSRSNVIPTYIDVGNIADVPIGRDINPGTRHTLSLLGTLQERLGGEWEVVPSLDQSNAPVFTANYAQRLGTDLRGTDIHLEEGLNIELAQAALMSIQGRVHNRVKVIGQALQEASHHESQWYTDTASRDLYGYAEAQYNENRRSQAAVDASAQIHLLAEAQPFRIFSGIVCNDKAMYPYLRIGNVMTLRLHTIGYQNNAIGGDYSVRIVEMQVDDFVPGVDLTLEEYND